MTINNANHNFLQLIGLKNVVGRSIDDFIILKGEAFTPNEAMKGSCQIIHQSGVIFKATYESYPGAEKTLVINISRADKEESSLTFDYFANNKGFAVIERYFGDLFAELRRIEQEENIETLAKYIYENTHELDRLHSLIKITQMNDEMLTLFEADNRNELAEHLSTTRSMNFHMYLNETLKLYSESGRHLEQHVKLNIVTVKQNKKVVMIRSRILDPKTNLLVNVYYDITDFERAQLQLEESELRYNRLFEDIPLAISIMRNSHLFRCNQKFLDEHHYSSFKEVQGMHIDEFIDPESRELLIQRRANRLISSNDATNSFRILMKRKDGTLYPAEVHAQRFNYDGELYSMGIEVNLTEQMEQEKLQKQLSESNRMESLAILSGGIAHDFNNLLMVINGGLEILSKTASFDQEDQRLLKDLISSGKKASDLVLQLLTYSGRVSISHEIVDVTKVINSSISMFRLVVSKNVEIQYNLLDIPLAVELSDTDISQIIINFLINASEAIGNRNGEIGIKTELSHVTNQDNFIRFPDRPLVDQDYVAISVIDNGRGISLDNIYRIFDPFFSTKSGGRGLGLSVILGIIKGVEGFVEVESSPGKGSTFRVLIPLSDKEVSTNEMEEIESNINISGKVLVCDDEPHVREVLGRMLKEMKLDVVECEDGRECIDRLNQDKDIDLIILDLTMPKMTGEEALRKIREKDRVIPIIISSGYLSEDIIRIESEENIEVLQKPYTLNNLKIKLRKLMGINHI
ncbi:MAG: hybrid sensor histidine kinase/response regulator [Candidatus Kariarchaeaceae archaeon]